MRGTVRRQVVLPWRQVVIIAFNSLRVRLFRSLITTFTLVLAIAFLVYIWTGYQMLNALWPDAPERLQERILASGYELFQGRFGTTPKDRWLALLSLLVCVVGIVNAQLMAVSERFREIGTIKCLGALDSFVVKIFVLESLYQGVMGGLCGAFLGILVATMSLTVHFGWIVLTHWPFWKLLGTVCWSTATALCLSLLGALYPAIVAARMEPANALRAEQ